MSRFKDYSIEWLKKASKQLQELSKNDQQKVIAKVDLLVVDSEQLDLKKLKGYKNLYRFRSGDYRVVFKEETNQQLIIIATVKHRKEVYKSL